MSCFATSRTNRTIRQKSPGDLLGSGVENTAALATLSALFAALTTRRWSSGLEEASA